MGYEFKANNDCFAMPLQRICARQRLDELTSTYWWNHDRSLKDEIVQISIEEKIPSVFHSMICFECNQKEKFKFDEKIKSKSASVESLGINADDVTVVAALSSFFGDSADDASGIFESVG